MKLSVKYLCMFYFLFGVQLHAQMIVNNNALITVNNGASVLVKGDLENKGVGTITNNGNIEVTGNWFNNSTNNCFGISTGTVTLSGAAQTIGGSFSTMFNNLILSGTANKTILTDQYVGGGYVNPSGVLQLNDKALILNSKILFVNNPSPSAITRTTGYIESETSPTTGYGYLQWNIGNSAPGNIFIFPFGNTSSNDYLPLSYSVTSAGIGGANGYAKIATYPTITASAPNNRPLPTGIGVLTNITGTENAPYVADRYYIFDVANYASVPQTDLTFSYRESEWNSGTNTINESNLQMQKIINGTQAWTYPPFGIVNTLSNTVTVYGWNSDYNPIWTIVDINSPLPVELIDFKASLNSGNKTDLFWITADESSVNYYELEKSDDGIHFNKFVQQIAPIGNQAINNYHAIDENPFNGITYYRLKIADINGSMRYSKVESVHLGLISNLNLSIFPNPATSYINLLVSSTIKIDGNWKIGIYDAIGKNILLKGINRLDYSGNNVVGINVETLPAGVYYLKLLSDNDSVNEVVKILIKK